MTPRNKQLLVSALSLFLAIDFVTDSLAACGKKNILRQIVGKDICRATKKIGKTVKKVVKEVGEEVEEAICKVGKIVDTDSKCNIAVGVAVNQNGEVGLVSGDGRPPEQTVSLLSRDYLIRTVPKTNDVEVIEMEFYDDNFKRKLYKNRKPGSIETAFDLVSLATGIEAWNRLGPDADRAERIYLAMGIGWDALAVAVPIFPGGGSFAAKTMVVSSKAGKPKVKLRIWQAPQSFFDNFDGQKWTIIIRDYSKAYNPILDKKIIDTGHQFLKGRVSSRSNNIWISLKSDKKRGIRISPGNPNSKYAHSQKPYVRICRGVGKTERCLDKSGNVVNKYDAKGHIPVKSLNKEIIDKAATGKW